MAKQYLVELKTPHKKHRFYAFYVRGSEKLFEKRVPERAGLKFV